MKIHLAQSSLILLCVAMAGAIGGGLYEQIVLASLWSRSPPSSFSIIQPGTGVPLQNFWIPVHAAITIFILLSLFLTWRQIKVRFRLLGSYIEVEISQTPSCHQLVSTARFMDLLCQALKLVQGGQ
jgi:hypothetical protein